MQAAGDETSITGINVTPLVDIILVVLIIFMATAPMLSRRQVKVDVPKTAHHERAATEAVSVAYNAAREIMVGGRKVTEAELRDQLARRAAAQENVHVTLSADKALPYGDIMGLLDLIRGAGVKKIGLEVQDKR